MIASLMFAQFLFSPSVFGCLLCQAQDNLDGPRYRSEPIAPASTSSASAIISNVTSTKTIAAIAPGKSASTPEFLVAGGQKYLSVSFAELASFTFKAIAETLGSEGDSANTKMEVKQQVPDAIKSLNEKSVAITGFILPVHTENGLTTDFLLLRNQSACCYGVMPKINEWVVVRSAGKGVKAVMDVPMTVAGTFHIAEHRENGVLTAIYQLDCDQLIPPKN